MKKRFGTVSLEEFKSQEARLLNPENRWIKLADAIDWDKLEEKNTILAPNEKYKAYPFRCMLGALILLDRTEMSSSELLEEVKENPYFQYFLGCKEFAYEDVFSVTALKKFTKTVVVDYKKYLKNDEILSKSYEDCKAYKDNPAFMQAKIEYLSEDNERYRIANEMLKRENALLQKEIDEKTQKEIALQKETIPVPVVPVMEENLNPKTLNEEQLRIFRMAMEGKDLFITGGAGTGKSYLLKRIIYAMEKEGMNVVDGAPTGMAALHVKGTTLHRLFSLGIGICEDLPVHAGNIANLVTSKAYKVLKVASVLVIDEISMCRADYFSRIARILAYERSRGHHIQLILCGDFFQLSPVVGNREKAYFRNVLHNPDGWAFLTPEWKNMNIPVCELRTIIRQNNPEFAKALNMIRVGNADGLDYITSHAAASVGRKGISLCGTNNAANMINTTEMHKLGNPIQEYEAKVLENKEDLDEEKEIKNITDKNIQICDGARVIITMNDMTGANEYHNGSMGYVVSHTDDSVTIQIDGRADTVLIERFLYKVYGYDTEWDKDKQRNILKKKVIFSFTQIPVKLGWAITIHKSQGQTYDAMTLETDSLWRIDGLLYVALSRVTGTEGLRLAGGHRWLYQMRQLLQTARAVKAYYRV